MANTLTITNANTGEEIVSSVEFQRIAMQDEKVSISFPFSSANYSSALMSLSKYIPCTVKAYSDDTLIFDKTLIKLSYRYFLTANSDGTLSVTDNTILFQEA